MNGKFSGPLEPTRGSTPEPTPLLPDHILAEFGIEEPHIEWLSGGRTNRTLRVRAGRDLVMQHMRSTAQSDLLGIMENLVRVTSHLEWRRNTEQTGDRWYPQLVPTVSGKPFIMTDDGDVWRAFSYRTGQILRSTQPVAALASAAAIFGRFTAQTADIGGPDLIATAPDFHNLDVVYDQLMGDLEQADDERKAPIADHMLRIEQVKQHVEYCGRQDGLGEVPHRVVHNDTKLSNVLFDRDHGRAKAVLDLDMAMMGPSWHDVGDLIRSASWHAPGAAPAAETCFSPELFDAVVGAFVEAAAETLTDHEVATYAVAGPRISLELGLRYLNDHLRDDPQLRVDGENGHFHRGIANVKLASEMLGAYDALRLNADGLIGERYSRTKGSP